MQLGGGVSLLALSHGSQSSTIVCRGTVNDLKLALVTLAAVMKGAKSTV